MEILYSNLGNLTWQQVVMWAIGGLLILPAHAKVSFGAESAAADGFRRNSGKSSDVGCD